MTRIQLATGFIDLPKGTDFPIDLSFAEITKSGARSGGVSRSLEIEGSENNTILLGSYFDIDLSNDTFDRNKKTTCSVIQNGVEVFEGFIQLKEITRVNKLRGTNRKLVKYKIEVFDEVSNFFNEMGDKELTELSFPEFSHIFNRTNIIASWSNTEGYTYPQYAKSDNIYTLRDFKPAIYEYEYFKKIFAANGYTFTFPQFDDDNIRMHKRVVPYNGKQGEDTIGQFLKQAFTVRGEMSSANYVIDASNTPTYPIGWLPFIDYISGTGTNSYATAAGSKVILSDIFEDAQNQWSFATDDLQNKAGASRTFQVLTSYEYNVQVKSEAGTAWQVEVGSGLSRCEIKLTLVAQSTTNPNKVAYIDAGQTIIDFDSGTHTYGSGLQPLASGENASFANIGIFDANEKFDVHVLIYARYFGINGNVIQNGGQFQSLNSLSVDDLNVTLQTEFVETASGDPVRLEFDIDITNLQFKAIPDITELVKGSNVDISQFIPKKIKQRDLISAISKSYNLVFVPDPENEKNIIIKTRDKYYQDGQEWDWTEKFAEDQPNNITFLSNDVKQKQAYKYTDDRDELNSAYQGEFVESYGQTTIQLDNEYTVGTDERTIIYSPTPSVGSAIGVPLPSINGVNPECNIRVLLHNGSGTVAPYPFYDDLLPNPSEFELVEDYCKTSMFDDDVFPDFSICFDAPNILFHGFQQGQTTNYLYQLQHQQELTTINEGERLLGYFDLTEGDFQKLSKRLDYKIFIKDNGWFFISNIAGYNSGKRTLTKVDLVTADEKTRLKFKKPKKPIKLTAINAVNSIKNHFRKVAQDSNIVISEGFVSIEGKYNYVAAEKVHIQGDQNKVLSSDVMVAGNYNNIGTGLNGIRLFGDNKTPTIPEAFVGGNFANENLTFDDNRTHNLNGFGLILENGQTIFSENTVRILNNTLANPALEIESIVSSQPALKLNGGASDCLALEVVQGGVKWDYINSGSTTYNITENDHVLEVTATTATVNLPNTSKNGLEFIIKYTGTGTCTINPDGSDTIDGDASLVLYPMTSVNLVFDGADWLITTKRPGELIASLTSSGNADQQLTTTAAQIDFDADDTAAYGSISRSGNVFTVSKDGLYMFNLQPQITELSPNNITIIWADKNGTSVANSAIRNSSTGVNDTHVEPLCITLDLVAGDDISFYAKTDVLLGGRLDFTAASSPVPVTPAVILDIKGWRK